MFPSASLHLLFRFARRTSLSLHLPLLSSLHSTLNGQSHTQHAHRYMHREGIKHGCSTITAPEYGNCRRLYVSSLCLYCVLNVRVGEGVNQRRAHCGNARSGEIEKRQNGNRNRTDTDRNTHTHTHAHSQLPFLLPSPRLSLLRPRL